MPACRVADAARAVHSRLTPSTTTADWARRRQTSPLRPPVVWWDDRSPWFRGANEWFLCACACQRTPPRPRDQCTIWGWWRQSSPQSRWSTWTARPPVLGCWARLAVVCWRCLPLHCSTSTIALWWWCSRLHGTCTSRVGFLARL